MNPNPDQSGLIKYKPGQSGNPAGKPLGSKNRSTIARKWLELLTKESNPLTGVTEELSQEDIITLAQIKKAKEEADTAAYKALQDSAYGAPKQEIDTAITGNIVLNVTDQDLKLGE
jgi:hypothetical protein